jgi:general secretion pathway protein F
MQFTYRAIDVSGAAKKGSLTANSEVDAYGMLRAQGLFPEKIKHEPIGKSSIFSFYTTEARSLSAASRLAYFQALQGLLVSGLPLDRAHQLLSTSTTDKAVRHLCERVAEGLASGLSLSACWQKDSAAFTKLETGLATIAEKTGSIPGVLKSLAEILQSQQDLRGKIITATAYPAFLVLMSIASLFFIAIVLLPSLVPMFEGNGREIPATLGILLTLTNSVSNHWLFWIVGIAALILLLRVAATQPTFNRKLQDFRIRIPLERNRAISRLATGLSVTLRNGLPLQEAVRTVAESSDLPLVRDWLQTVGDRIAEGAPLHTSMSVSGLLDQVSIEMVRHAERGATLPQAFAQVAERSETNVRRQIEWLSALLTPVLTVLMGLLIGGLLISVMQAILDMNDLVLR